MLRYTATEASASVKNREIAAAGCTAAERCACRPTYKFRAYGVPFRPLADHIHVQQGSNAGAGGELRGWGGAGT